MQPFFTFGVRIGREFDKGFVFDEMLEFRIA